MNEAGRTTTPSKIVQVVYGDDLLALCDDGSVWCFNVRTHLWYPVSPAHVAT